MAKELKIALCMIARNKEDIIARALDSTKGVFDGYFLTDTGSTDNTITIFQEWCEVHNKDYNVQEKQIGKDYKQVIVDGKPTLGDFASPRNDNFQMVKDAGYDYAMWLDTDDIVKNPEEIRNICKFMNERKLKFALMTYVYGEGQNGLNPVVQERERIIDLKQPGKWEKRVHENYNMGAITQNDIVRIQDVEIIHKRTGFESLATNRRNNLILQEVLEEEGIDNIGIDELNNLAFDHWEHREFEKAIEYYLKILERTEGKMQVDQAFMISNKLARAYIGLGNVESGIIHAIRASKAMPQMAEPYLILAEIYLVLNQLDEVLHYADKVLALGKPETTAPVNDMDYYIHPRRIKMQALMNMGRVDEALVVAEEVVQLLPEGRSKEDKRNILQEKLKRNAIQGINNLLKYLQNTNRMDISNRLKLAIPTDLKDNPIVRNLIKEMRHDYNIKTRNVKLDGAKSIVIYAGPHYESWDGNSDKERGIGGSEGMTIQMAKELAKLGNKVFVYGNPEESKVIDGVHYEHYTKWNHQTKSDIFISLRNPNIFSGLINSKKQYLWLHDTEYGDIPLSYFYAPNKVFVLSEAHKAVIKENHGITDDSIFYLTRNAVNEYALEQADKGEVERNPYQVIYASSYDRGLDNLLKIWPVIKKQVPEATLKIFYGWNTYDAMMQARTGTPQGNYMQKYKSEILELIASNEGVQELGRISQVELYKEFTKSSIWLYPTQFYEISCINAMTAQAMGAVPVCTPHAALNETVNTKYGMKLELDNIAEGTVALLKDQEDLQKRSKALKKWARKEFDIKPLAKEWDKLFSQ